MTILPASLFGRLVLVLLSVLLAAQFIAAAILLRDRGSAVYEASGLHAAHRIAGIVRLLDTLDSGQRDLVLRAVNSPTFRVMFSRPHVMSEPMDVHALHLASVLHRILGEERLLQVAFMGETPTERMEPGMLMPDRMSHEHSFPPRAGGFFVQVQLHDGNWVSFAQRLPRESFRWPGRLLVTLGILLVSVMVVSLIAVRWVTQPLTLLGQAADDLGHNLDRAPLKEEGPQEVRRAAQAFNAMQARLQRYLRDRERLLAAVSHDLKTPITRLRLRTELLEDERLRSKFLQDLHEMEHMATSALDFMRTAHEREALQPTDINALLESLQADNEEIGRPIRIEGRAERAYRARPAALKRALSNLLDNAAKYGGQARVCVEDSSAQLQIIVRDNGPGIPEEQLEAAFEPFFRIEGSRSRATGGVGLGLSIARDIIRGHCGDVVLRNGAAGGLEAVVTLPREIGSQNC